ncbi:hypothetical protein [Kocuria rhizosphaericola]|uniref:hypothetical protein n=1 Tax=Kocuria rhizosphaericola TaxID=3376284 RepID=UPI0037B2C7AD
MIRRSATDAAPLARRGRGLRVLALAVPLFLAGCTSVEVAVESPPQGAPAATASAVAQEPSSNEVAPRPVVAPKPAATRTFTTPDGAYSFEHPAEWTVTEDPSQVGVYAVRRSDGALMAGLATGGPADPVASPVYPITSYTSVEVPGLVGPLGRTMSAAVGLYPGHSIGSEAIAYGLADGGDPTANYGRVRSADASFLYFGGTKKIGNGSTMLSEDAVRREMAAYTASTEGRTVLAMLSSLTVDPSVTGRACQDGHYVYTDLQGLGCDDAQDIVNELRSAGSAEGENFVASDHYFCAGEDVEPTVHHDPMYACGVYGAGDIGFHLDPATITADHPLLHIETDSPDSSAGEMTAEVVEAAVDCTGVNYEFTEVDGLTCPEAKGMLQPFLEGRGAPADSNAQVVDDTECTRAPAERGGATVPSWSCSRTQGGSFVAYARL